jgi:hypothetical protein
MAILGKVSIAMLPSEETVFARGDLAWVRAILRKSSIAPAISCARMNA